MRIKLGLSFAGKKNRLLAYSSVIIAFVDGAAKEEGTLDEFEAIKAKKKNLI